MTKLVHEIKEWIRAIFIALIILLLIGNFCFQKFKIPTNSMDQTLITGDFIIVNKLAYGARFPITWISLPFTHKTIGKQKSYSDIIEFPYYRVPGYDSIQRNDVIVFNYPLEDSLPIDKREFYIKRIIGMPSDTMAILDKEISINGEEIPSNPLEKHIYYAFSKDSFPIHALHKLKIVDYGPLNDKRTHYQISLTNSQLKKVIQIQGIKKIEPAVFKKGISPTAIFPEDWEIVWDLDNYGPIIVPQKGKSMPLSDFNLAMYKRIIEVYEENQLILKGDSIFINGELTKEYTFKDNYYFVLGDNRHNSADSRFWGFVPESHILGKASTIFWSMDTLSLDGNIFTSIGNYLKAVRWDRILKPIS